MAPFSYESRREIGERDNWTCHCGRSFQEGWMVEASHENHFRDSFYDDPENGVIECRACHLNRSIQLMLVDDPHHSQTNVAIQASRCWNKGLHTYEQTTKRSMRRDRGEIMRLLNRHGLNPDEFLKY